MQTRGLRPTIVLCILYAALIGVWLGFARGLAPAIVLASSQGRTPWVLNRLAWSWRNPVPPATPLQQWFVFSSAVAIAGVSHLVVVLLVRALDRRSREEQPAIESTGERWTNIAVVSLSLVFLVLTVSKGAMQDYYLYVQIWREVRLGKDPWFLVDGVWGSYPLNAYGPLFNALAIPAAINPLFPKLLFATAYLLFAIWLVKSAGESPGSSGWRRTLRFVWLFGPFAWVEIAYFGHFDVLVGLLCLAAVEARARDRDVLSGVSLGIGVLLKYMPVVLLPFLVLDHGRIRTRLAIASAATIVLGLAASVLLWGHSIYRPLLFAASRPSEHLSIFRFLKGPYSPLRWIEINENPDEFSVPILSIALLLAWSRARRSTIGPASLSVMAMLLTLLFYQVGFSQYQMVLFVLGSSWVIQYREEIRHRPGLWIALVCYFGWISVFDLIDALTDLNATLIPQWGGLPTFVLGCVLLICCLRSATTSPGSPPQR